MSIDLRERVLTTHCATNDLARDACRSLLDELARLRRVVGGDDQGAPKATRCPDCGQVFGGEVGARGLEGEGVVDCGPDHVVTYPDVAYVGGGASWAIEDAEGAPPG